MDINKEEKEYLFRLITTQLMKSSYTNRLDNFVLMMDLYKKLSPIDNLPES